MYQILKPGQIVRSEVSKMAVEVCDCLGGGTQGEVYKVSMNESELALKWYFPHYLESDPRLRERLDMAIRLGPPTNRFLWPMELASVQDVRGFGYLMPLRESSFKSINDLMARRVEPSFRALATAAFESANSYRQLHAEGLCYRDISLSNIFFDANTGEVRICDNDNVDFDGMPGAINGTPRFMAPEIVRGEAVPSRHTDLFSLAVLLFHMLTISHPLDGKKEDSIHSLDHSAMNKLYGREPVFIFDPRDESNRPVPGRHPNALVFWPIYPEFLRDLFVQSFTVGLGDPKGGRVQEGQWQDAMVRLRDSIFVCSECGTENFYDPVAVKSSGGKLGACWNCKRQPHLPPRIRLGKSIVMLSRNTRLYPHHVNDARTYDFSKPMSEVTSHPTKAELLGLKNLSEEKWVVTLAGGALKDVEPGRSIALSSGLKINFGMAVGDVRVD